MAEICCPYCNGRNYLKIVYSYRGVNKRKIKNINYDNYLKEGTIFRSKKYYNKIDFDGEKITGRLYNRYCLDCNREYHSAGKMAVIDIKKINIILGSNKERKRYIFDLYNINKPTYCFKKDYITVKEGLLKKEDADIVLKVIKECKTNLWKGHYGTWESFNDNYWILKLEYYNGLTEFKSGSDEYPNNWQEFIRCFNNIFEKYNLL